MKFCDDISIFEEVVHIIGNESKEQAGGGKDTDALQPSLPIRKKIDLPEC